MIGGGLGQKWGKKTQLLLVWEKNSTRILCPSPPQVINGPSLIKAHPWIRIKVSDVRPHGTIQSWSNHYHIWTESGNEKGERNFMLCWWSESFVPEFRQYLELFVNTHTIPWVWFHKENIEETKFLHSTRDLKFSTVNRESPGAFKEFLLRVWWFEAEIYAAPAIHTECHKKWTRNIKETVSIHIETKLLRILYTFSRSATL